MSLFDDVRALVAAGDARGSNASTADVLNAALAALPREELIAKATAAVTGAWSNGYARPVALPNDARIAEAVLVAIGLIPEHAEQNDERHAP